MTIQIKATERYFPVALFVTVFKVVLTVSLTTKSCGVTFQIKATQQYFQMVLFAFQLFTKWKLEILSNFFFLFVGVEELKGHDENPPKILCKTREGNLNHSLRRSPPCKGIQDNLGFWIPRCGFQIPDTIEFLLWVSLWIKLWILCQRSSHSGIQ